MSTPYVYKVFSVILQPISLGGVMKAASKDAGNIGRASLQKFIRRGKTVIDNVTDFLSFKTGKK